jgi:hypothetical protein
MASTSKIHYDRLEICYNIRAVGKKKDKEIQELLTDSDGTIPSECNIGGLRVQLVVFPNKDIAKAVKDTLKKMGIDARFFSQVGVSLN